MVWLALTVASWAAPEQCNGVDDDGDGQIDEGPVVWALDEDGDDFGSRAELLLEVDCSQQPPNTRADLEDCDDTRGAVHPGAAEICNLRDDDCDGQLDEVESCGDRGVGGGSVVGHVAPGGPWEDGALRCDDEGGHLASIDSAALQAVARTVADGREPWIGASDWEQEGVYVWSDGTSWGFTQWDTSQPDNHRWVEEGEDCVQLHGNGDWNDAVCGNVLDYLCERECDTPFYLDADGDGLGGAATSVVVGCVAPEGHVANDVDCDDTDAAWPAVLYFDGDDDGWGDSDAAQVGCEQPGWVRTEGDCDDTDDGVHPGAVDVAGDGLDSDCDGTDAPGPDPDRDGDGLSDREELVLGSDPDNPDTDGDGVLDGAETVDGLLDAGGDGIPDAPDARWGFGLCATSSGTPQWLWVVLVCVVGALRRSTGRVVG
ncbi:MAG: hypothetical protein KTR31_02515 [Myxococcales bacterium]|nr:hypothetical protein [Myxococcales bacterium]